MTSQRATLLDHEAHDAQLPGFEGLRLFGAKNVRAIANAEIIHTRDDAAQVAAQRVLHPEAVPFDRASDRGPRLEPFRENGFGVDTGRRTDFNLVEGHHHDPYVLHMFCSVNAENGCAPPPGSCRELQDLVVSRTLQGERLFN